MSNTDETRNIGIYIFDKVEVLDFAGPFEVFSTASRVYRPQKPDAGPLFNVFTVADSLRTIHARGGLQVLPKYDISNHPKIDVLVVPGGIVSDELEREKVVDWIANCDRTTKITASVCTGAFLLAKASLLNGKPATTHWEDIPDLRAMFPRVDVRENTRWIDTGEIVSSAGILAGIDMSLHLVARLEKKSLAVATARQMEFDWQDSGVSI